MTTHEPPRRPWSDWIPENNKGPSTSTVQRVKAMPQESTDILKNFKLAKGKRRNKQGELEEYKREFGFDPGMDDLINVVAGLNKEVKFMKNVLTYPEAQAYAAKHRNWEAHEADITGPYGSPDGVPEVFITDARGKVKVINGYKLSDEDYGLRKAYNAAVPMVTRTNKNNVDYHARAVKPAEFNEYYSAVKLNEYGEPEYANKFKDNKYIPEGQRSQFEEVRGKLSAKKVFHEYIYKWFLSRLEKDITSYLLGDLVDGRRTGGGWLNENHNNPFDAARVISQAENLAYAALIKINGYKTRASFGTLKGPDRKKFENKKEFKDFLRTEVAYLCRNRDSENTRPQIEKTIRNAIFFAVEVVNSGDRKFGEDETIKFVMDYNPAEHQALAHYSLQDGVIRPRVDIMDDTKYTGRNPQSAYDFYKARRNMYNTGDYAREYTEAGDQYNFTPRFAPSQRTGFSSANPSAFTTAPTSAFTSTNPSTHTSQRGSTDNTANHSDDEGNNNLLTLNNIHTNPLDDDSFESNPDVIALMNTLGALENLTLRQVRNAIRNAGYNPESFDYDAVKDRSNQYTGYVVSHKQHPNVFLYSSNNLTDFPLPR